MTAAFVILSLAVLGAAVMVVASRRVAHAAVWLVVNALALAGLFLLLGAEFAAAVQVIVYAGSVVVLFVFTAMTTGFAESVRPAGRGAATAAVVAAAVVGTQLAALLARVPAGEAPAGRVDGAETVAALGRLAFGEWLLPLEVFSLVILAVMVGAAAIRRERGGDGE